MVDAPDAGWTSASTLDVLAGAAVLLAGFLLVETRSRAPLVPLRGLVTRVGPRPIAALSMALLGVGSLLLAQVSQAAFTACAIVSIIGLIVAIALLPRPRPRAVLPRGSLGDRQRLARDREALVEEMAQMSDERPAAAR